jgi:hypothetical protein
MFANFKHLQRDDDDDVSTLKTPGMWCLTRHANPALFSINVDGIQKLDPETLAAVAKQQAHSFFTSSTVYQIL